MIVSHIFASLKPLVNCLTNIWTSLKICMSPFIMSNWLSGNLFVWQVLFLGETSPIGSNHLLLASSFLLYHWFLQIILPLSCIYLYVVEVLFYSLHLINNYYSVVTWINAAFGPRMHPYLSVSFHDLCHDKVSWLFLQGALVVCSVLGSCTHPHTSISKSWFLTDSHLLCFSSPATPLFWGGSFWPNWLQATQINDLTVLIRGQWQVPTALKSECIFFLKDQQKLSIFAFPSF